MGIGVIIRDEKGGVIAAISKTREGLLEPTTGEAITLFFAMGLRRDIATQNVMFEGDAKQVMDAMNSTMSRWSRFGHLLEDTRHSLQRLSRCKCVYVNNEANEATHQPAKKAILNVNDRIWRVKFQILSVMLF
jgi:ribonuclease HI